MRRTTPELLALIDEATAEPESETAHDETTEPDQETHSP